MRADVADDIFREIDEDLRAERTRAMARRFGAVAVLVVILALAGLGVWQFEASRARQRAMQTAVTYFAATDLADSGEPALGASASGNKAAALFEQVVRRGPEGFRTLARLRLAQLAWAAGDTKRALGFWQAIHDDGAADPTLRGLASLLWVQHQIGTGDPALLASRLGELSQPGGAWRAMAQELDAQLDLRTGQVAEAKRKLAALSQDGQAPEALRERATGLNQIIEAPRQAPVARAPKAGAAKHGA